MVEIILKLNILEIIGLITIIIVFIVMLYKLYRYFFGYSYDSCPNNHDTMARYGTTKCNKCNREL